MLFQNEVHQLCGRMKTYLRPTMPQSRLNDVMILHIHKHLTDDIDVVAALNEFVSVNEDRRKHFGIFTE